jgi:hypothetical protein
MYSYSKESARLYNDGGIKLIILTKEEIDRHIRTAGFCTVGKALQGSPAIDSFQALAAIDWLIENRYYDLLAANRQTHDNVLIPYREKNPETTPAGTAVDAKEEE